MFYAGSFIYFGFFGNYEFFYQEKSSLFIFSFDFLRENLHQPGGLLIWLAKFLSTFFYFPVAGAVIVSTVMTLIILSISKIIGLLTGKDVKIFPFTIGLTLFWLQTEYRFLLHNNLGILIQLALFWLTIKYLNKVNGWIPVATAPLWYFVTGGFAWVFSLMLTFCFIFDKEKKGWIKIIVLWCLNFLIIFISKEILFFQPIKILLFFPFTDIAGLQQIFFLSVTGILSFLPLISIIKLRGPSKISISAFTRSIVISIFIILILFIIGLQRFDKKVEQYFHVENLFYQHKYNEVIAFNAANPSTNSLTIFLNNIALCETDKLNDLLFHFPQSSDGQALFLKWEMSREILRRGGYFYYTIGMVNEAHRWAFENMVMKGHSPEGLKMLIRTELITGNYQVASKYIDILKNTIFYKKEANAFEKLLFNDSAVNADPELGEKRKNRLKSDFFSITDDPYINIERILATDSLNRNAFEYKLAFLLLKKDYQGIAKELPKFQSLGFTKLPANVEEATVALSLLNKGNLADLGNIQVTRDTELRWIQFLTIFQQYGANPKAAEPALRKQFGNTFWYYAFYR